MDYKQKTIEINQAMAELRAMYPSHHEPIITIALIEQITRNFRKWGEAATSCKSAFIYFNPSPKTYINLFEKLILFFIKKQYLISDGSTLVYKEAFGRYYILDHFINPPMGYNCRHTLIPIK